MKLKFGIRTYSDSITSVHRGAGRIEAYNGKTILSRISKFALKEQFLYMCSSCNLLFYFAVIILFVIMNCLKPKTC